MMNKYDELLNELVYEIDDLVYNFYSVSNELIAHKKGQDRLFDFRDKTVDIINTMNVRSLEMISKLKKRDDVEERAQQLITKNKELIDSSFEVIRNSSNKSELLEDLGALSAGVYETAKETISKVEESGVVDRFVNKTKEGFDDLVNNPNVKKGTAIVKEKSKEAAVIGSKALKESGKTLSKWWDELEKDVEKTAKDTKDAASEVKEQVVESAEDLKEKTSATAKDFSDDTKDAVEDLKDTATDLKKDTKEEADKITDDLKEAAEDVKDKVKEKAEKTEDLAEDVVDEIEDTSDDIQKDMDELFADVQDAGADTVEEVKENKDEAEDDIIVFLEKSEKNVQDAVTDLKQEDSKDEESNDL